MTTVAIVCEYNPFHNGHEYQIAKIREEFGEDTVIIGIMSGNFTQRGEFAIADKGTRAKCAVHGGANLILELPFPYSMSSAEIFASAAVHIADSLEIIDYLSFGSESGDIQPLTELASLMMSEDFNNAVHTLSNKAEFKGRGYPEIIEEAVKMLGYDKKSVEFSPNNILALEYIKALKNTKSNIKPHTIKRVGASYSSNKINANGKYESATAIRNEIMAKNISALEYVPIASKQILLNEIKIGAFPCDSSKLSSAIIASLRLSSPEQPANVIHDCNGGLFYRLREKSFEANNIDTLLRLCETKAYTNARLRRALMYTFFGVTSSDVKSTPLFTQILAFDCEGQAILKKIRKRCKIAVLTKPSRTDELTSDAMVQKMRADRADAIFQMTKPEHYDGNYAVRFTPYVKK